MTFEQSWKETAQRIENYLKAQIPQLAPGEHPGLQKLRQAMEYSTYDGGKRFRPVLCLWTYEMLKGKSDFALPFAAAVEMVHCYSLIHDDLPAMDDDDFRRGRPSNHKVFGEAFALLAGNSLLTEAFSLIAKEYRQTPLVAARLMELLAHSAGARGMVGGQAIDMLKIEEELSPEDLSYLHSLKTGVLIRCAVEGAAILAEATEEQEKALRKYAEHLGLAFQVADDVLDHDPDKAEPASYPAVMGVEDTKSFLTDVTESALKELKMFGAKANNLIQVANYNLMRQK